MKALLLRTVILARRHRTLSNSTRREYRRRLERRLDAVMALVPTNLHGLRLRRRYGKLREHLFTFLEHPDVTADNNSSDAVAAVAADATATASGGTGAA